MAADDGASAGIQRWRRGARHTHPTSVVAPRAGQLDDRVCRACVSVTIEDAERRAAAAPGVGLDLAAGATISSLPAGPDHRLVPARLQRESRSLAIASLIRTAGARRRQPCLWASSARRNSMRMASRSRSRTHVSGRVSSSRRRSETRPRGSTRRACASRCRPGGRGARSNPASPPRAGRRLRGAGPEHFRRFAGCRRRSRRSEPRDDVDRRAHPDPALQGEA